MMSDETAEGPLLNVVAGLKAIVREQQSQICGLQQLISKLTTQNGRQGALLLECAVILEHVALASAAVHDATRPACESAVAESEWTTTGRTTEH